MSGVFPQYLSTFIFKTGSPTTPEIHPLGKVVWQMSFRSLPISSPTPLEVSYRCAPHLALDVGPKALNSGPHASVADTLPAEPPS